MPIPHRCTPFDLSNCTRAHQELRQDSPHLFQRARVLRGDLVSCSCCPPEFLQSTDGIVEKAAEQFDFASTERSTPVYIRVWSTFQLACPLTQGGENVPNRVRYCEGSRQLPPCSALGCPLRQRAIDGISALRSRNEEKDFGSEAVWVLALVEGNLRVVVRELADEAFVSHRLAQR